MDLGNNNVCSRFVKTIKMGEKYNVSPDLHANDFLFYYITKFHIKV